MGLLLDHHRVAKKKTTHFKEYKLTQYRPRLNEEEYRVILSALKGEPYPALQSTYAWYLANEELKTPIAPITVSPEAFTDVPKNDNVADRPEGIEEPKVE